MHVRDTASKTLTQAVRGLLRLIHRQMPCSEQEWKDALEAKAAAEEEACKQEQARAQEEEEAADLARIEKEKRDVCTHCFTARGRI